MEAKRPDALDSGGIFGEGCVNVWLTDGLTGGTPTFTKKGFETSIPATATDRSFDTSVNRECGGISDADGVFKLPVLHSDAASIMKLPVTVSGTATVNEQCLTAEISTLPPTGPGELLDYPSDNRVLLCLGETPTPGLFQTGVIDIFDFRPCRLDNLSVRCD